MTAVAIRLVVRGATAAESQLLSLADGATRAAYDFQIAGNGQRTVVQRPDGNWAVAGFKWRYIAGRRLARRHETGGVMGTIAKWLVL